MSLRRVPPGADGFSGQALRLGAGQAVGKGLNFLGFLLVARALGPSQYGGLTFALSLGSLLIFLPNLGMDPLFSREVPAGRARASDLLGSILALKAAAVGLFLIVYLCIVFTTATSAPVRAAAMPVALAMGLLAISQTWRTVLITSGRAGLAGMLEVLAPGVFVLASMVTIGPVPTASRAALGFLVGQLVAALAGAIVVLRRFQPSAPPRTPTPYLRILKLAFPLMMIWFFSDLYLRVDMTILYYLRGDAQAGLYGASYRLVEGVYSGALVICAVSLPRMAGAWSHGVREWRQEWVRAVRLLLLIVIPVAAVLCVAAAPVIGLLYGAEFAQAAGALRILAPATVFLCLGYVYGAALTSIGREWAQMAITALALLANVLLNFLLIPSYGGQGAAFATLVSAVAYLLFAHRAIARGVASGRPLSAATAPLTPP